mmetsp:Transcript_2447/g.5193  ORF Transcript_2447/g.5193 Transcript_2447/m.5193 type:complete len:344 (-) Transcript_2447:463-1494(-)|eukprot:scaffold10856_cov229-Amphora_coffeaeformis.AAC.18
MNPRIKHIAFGSSQVIPHVSQGPVASSQSSETLRDEAALLLSIADICNKEMKDTGISMLWSDEAEDDGTLFPKFPSLTKAAPSSEDSPFLKPRSELPSRENSRHPRRPRAVSMDSGRLISTIIDDEYVSEDSDERSVSSPVSFTSPMNSDPAPPIVTPTTTVSIVTHRRLPMRKQSHRLLRQSKREHREATMERVERPPVSGKDKKGKAVQGTPPKGVPIKKIMRKKFSWKNYPELERFLVANREEYLRHSALNYTVQQKQYNNRLTDELLELATQHGYLFDTNDFSYVTVRDRIRCYFKSYVQSAKKRGILMGYAARKAGLLDEDELESHGTGDLAPIIKNP